MDFSKVLLTSAILLWASASAVPQLPAEKPFSLDALTGEAHPPPFVFNGTFFNPVIFVPGDGGSRLEARILQEFWAEGLDWSAHYKPLDWGTIWVNEPFIASGERWAEVMRLEYDFETRTTRDREFIEIRVPGFGDAKTLEFLDENESYPYFIDISRRLRTMGYKRGENLHGAPYDFRKAPNEHGQYFKNVKTLVEDTYKRNGNKKVIFICHSMGSPMMLYFLNRQTQAWKDEHIKAYINLAGSWGGTIKAMIAYALGDKLGSAFMDNITVRRVLQTTPSTMWMMPSEHLWKEDELVLESPNFSLTASNLTAYFKVLNRTDGLMMYEDTKDLTKDLTPPGVDTFCLHSSGVKSYEKLTYHHTYGQLDPDNGLHVLRGDGDGTVNLRSLQACTEFEGKQKQKFHHQVFPDVEHLDMMSDEKVLDYVHDIVKELLLSDEDEPKIEIV